MGALDRRVARALDELVPPRPHPNRWELIVGMAETPIRKRRRWLIRAVPAAGVAVAALVLALAWPFGGGPRGSVLERAAAAIGEGPVLHVVLRGEWGGTVVELKSGSRRPVYGEREIWYDTAAGRVHSIGRLGGVVLDEELYDPQRPPVELAALGREYRRALESGTARVVGEGTIDGEPVVWLTIRRELLPDVADGKEHEWAQQVAVSRRTFKPFALRETRDGEPGPFTGQRVLELEFLPSGAGDFSAPKERSLNGTAVKEGREPLALEQAHALLGRTPLWLGHEYRGLKLAAVYRQTTSVGRRREVSVTGATAAAALKCSRLRGGKAGKCFRALGVSPLEVRSDGVFTSSGPIVWSDEQSAVVLFYGTIGDDPSTHATDAVPRFDLPHLTITETTQLSRYQPGAMRYVPPPGSVFLPTGARSGILQVNGIYVTIVGANEETILGAAADLEVMR